MDRIKKLNAIQDKAVDALEEADWNASILACTGYGNIFFFL